MNIANRKIERYIYIVGGIILITGFVLLSIVYGISEFLANVLNFWGS